MNNSNTDDFNPENDQLDNQPNSLPKGTNSSAGRASVSESHDTDNDAARKDSSQTKSPGRSQGEHKESYELAEDNDFLSEKEAQQRRIQQLMRKTSDSGASSPVKANSQKEPKLKLGNEGDSDEDDQLGQTRQRHEVIFAGKGDSPLKGHAHTTTHRKEKSYSIVEPSFHKEHEFQRQLSHAASDSSSVLLPSRNSDITKSIGTGKELKFLDKANWTDELTCYVCCRAFNKIEGIFTHHCRACGKSVCGDCSTRKINDNRACDVCFYKASNVLVEEKRKNMLIEKTRMIEEYKRKAEEAQKYLEELTNKKKELEKKIYDEREEHDNAFIALQKEKVKVQETLDKKKSNNQKLRETLESEQQALRKKEEETREIKEGLNIIRLDLAEKKGNINSKQEESERLVSQRQYYVNSCIGLGDGSILQRDPSFFGSCFPDLPGTDTSDRIQEDSSEPGSSQKDEE